MKQIGNLLFVELPSGEKKFDKVKFTWVRHLLYFMIAHPSVRSKFVLRMLRNFTTHKLYLNNKIVHTYKLKDITP